MSLNASQTDDSATVGGNTESDRSSEQTADTRPAWTPTEDSTSAARECQRCGSRVSERFARVFGDNDDEVHGCLECMSAADVKRGGTKEGNDGSMYEGIRGGAVYGDK